jgi:hypothetical protein
MKKKNSLAQVGWACPPRRSLHSRTPMTSFLHSQLGFPFLDCLLQVVFSVLIMKGFSWAD